MLFQFKCKMNYDDYYEFNKYHAYNSPDVKKSNFFLKLVMPIIFLIILLYRIICNYDPIYIIISAVIFSIASVIGILGIGRLHLAIMKIHIGFMKKSGKLPYSEVADMQFFDDHFVEITKDTKTEIKYSAVCRVCINEKKAIYIYQNAVMAYVIPFTVFGSAEEAKKFIDFIKDKTKL